MLSLFSKGGSQVFFFFFFLFGPFTRFFIYPIFTNDKTSPTSIIARSFAFRTKRHATVAFQPTFAPPWERRLNRDRKESRERDDLRRWSFADNGERVFSSEFHVRLKCTRCLSIWIFRSVLWEKIERNEERCWICEGILRVLRRAREFWTRKLWA